MSDHENAVFDAAIAEESKKALIDLLGRRAEIEKHRGKREWPSNAADDTDDILSAVFPGNPKESVLYGAFDAGMVATALQFYNSLPGERLNMADIDGRFDMEKTYTRDEVTCELVKRREEKRMREHIDTKIAKKAKQVCKDKERNWDMFVGRCFGSGETIGNYAKIIYRYADIFWAYCEGSYTGDISFMLRSKIDTPAARYGYVALGYGSCAVCDAYDSCCNEDEKQGLGQRLVEHDAFWFDSVQQLRDWLKQRDWPACCTHSSDRCVASAISRCDGILGLTCADNSM